MSAFNWIGVIYKYNFEKTVLLTPREATDIKYRDVLNFFKHFIFLVYCFKIQKQTQYIKKKQTQIGTFW